MEAIGSSDAVKQKRVGVTILGSGSNGNCTIVHCGDQAIMIDAGFSCREIKRRFRMCPALGEISVDGILVTHEHTDHVNGLRLCSNLFEAPIYATTPCARVMRDKGYASGQIACFVPGGEFRIGPFAIMPFTIPHDAKSPVGFIVTVNDLRIGFATDVGYISTNVEYNLRGCDALVVESNHDMNMLAASSRPWQLKQRIMSREGHLSNESTAQLLEKIIAQNTKHVVLAHLSRECNTHEKALECSSQAISNLGRADISLTAAHQEEPLDTTWL